MKRSAASASWQQSLDRLEADLHAGRAHLGDPEASPAPGPWEPPVVLGPLPGPLLDRAEYLLGELLRLQDTTREESIRIALELRDLRRPRHPTPRTSAGLDISA